ncbi:hypothetical protein EMCRGX_G026246 [Ephydatia muelleri]
MSSKITTVLWLVAILRITHQLALKCEASMCNTTVISCAALHPYGFEMTKCFPTVFSKPSLPDVGDDCPFSSEPLSQTVATIPDAPSNVRYSLASLNPEVFATIVSWSMNNTDGLTGFRVEVFEEMAYPDHGDRNLYQYLITCLLLDSSTFSYKFEKPYTPQEARIRVQITSLPYNTSAIMNTNFVTFPSPASCLDILGSFPTTCNSPRYGSPSITVKPSHLLDKLGRLTGEMEVNVTWSSGIPGSMYPPPSHYFVMVAPSTVPISCQNIASTSCFITNETSVVLKPLNTSITYQVAVQSYTPCSNGPCSYPSKITRIRAPSLVPIQTPVGTHVP